MRRRVDRSFVFGAGFLVVAAVALVVAILVAGDDDPSSGPPCPGADGRSRELRSCLADSLAFVSTPFGTGSAVLLADGHLVTNAHVIDPYAVADVTFDGGEAFEAVPVIGVDASSDIAVLGPITTERAGLRLDPVPDFEAADEEPEVFLVGYPGGIEDDQPDITLSGGLFSRFRDDAAFGLRYLQTDAAIAGGQSGGALVDADGRVLGISGLGFAEEFALALSADDVQKSIERILAGQGDARRVMPSIDDAGTAPVDVELTEEQPTRLVVIPAAPERREVELTIDAEFPIAVDVFTYVGEPIGSNDVSLDLADEFAEDFGDQGMGLPPPDELDEPSPGTYRIDVPVDEDVVVALSNESDLGLTAVTVEIDVPFVVFEDTVMGEDVSVGTPVRHVVDGFTWEVLHTLELEEGDQIEVTVRAGPADAYFTLLGPDEVPDPFGMPTGEDGGGGLYDLDPQETLTVDESGTHRLYVGTYAGIVGAYELSVERVED